MSHEASARLDGIKHKPLVMKGESLLRRGEADHKKVVVAGAEQRAFVAQLIGAAIEHSGLTRKDAAFRMGYGDDQTPISRWTAGLEPPQMARFCSVKELRFGLAVALAQADDCADVDTVLRFRRRLA